MSWLENLEAKLSITTGDGLQWPPLYVKSKRVREFNTAEFNYVNVAGTDVQRRLPKAHRYTLEIMFVGDACITDALAFDNSAADQRSWTIQHPIYGRLVVQPLDLAIDNSVWNVSRITVTAVVTNSSKGVTVIANAPQAIQAAAFLATQSYADLYSTEVPIPPTSVLQQMTAQVNNAYNSIQGQITNAADHTAFLNAYNDANTLINNTVFDVNALVGSVQSLASFPASFLASSSERVRLLGVQLAGMFTNALLTATSLVKGVYEFNAGTGILSMCTASITNYEYGTRGDVVGVIATLTDAYNAYLANLDALQSNNGSEPGAYIADPSPLGAVTDLVNYTIATLYSIAEQAKQVRAVSLEEDMPLVVAVFKYYGLTADDATIDSFIAINSIGVNELILLKKGRRIIYYV